MKTRLILIATTALFAACSSEKRPANEAYLPKMSATPNQGTWQKQGLDVNLRKDREFTLDTKGDGFIIDFTDAIYRNNQLFAIGTTVPEIIVYDSSGAYVRTIHVNPAPRGMCSFRNIDMAGNGNLLIKDINSSEILEIDGTGAVVSKLTTKNPDGTGKNHLAPFGMAIVESPHERIVYSEIFQWLDSKNFMETLIVGRFDADGQLSVRFARHHPILEEYNLSVFQPSDFVVVGDELFLMESSLPVIRVFSLMGELKRTFGDWGAHQRPLEKMPAGLTELEEGIKSHDYTWYLKIEAIPKVGNFKDPLIAVHYMNPEHYSEAALHAARDKGEGIKGDHYLMVYTVHGDLLMNDIPLPGSLLEVDDQGRLVLLLQDEAENRRIGFYRLEMGEDQPVSSK